MAPMGAPNKLPINNTVRKVTKRLIWSPALTHTITPTIGAKAQYLDKNIEAKTTSHNKPTVPEGSASNKRIVVSIALRITPKRAPK